MSTFDFGTVGTAKQPFNTSVLTLIQIKNRPTAAIKMPSKRMLSVTDGGPFVVTASAILEADVFSLFVICITTCTIVGLLGKQGQLLRIGYLIGVFFGTVTASIPIGN